MTNDLKGQQPRPVLAGELGQLFQPKLLSRLRETLRFHRYSLKTEKAYVQWVRRYIHCHGKQQPEQMGADRVTASLKHLANGRGAASTQNQALAAVLLLYKEVLEIELPWLDHMVHAKTPRRLPTFPTTDEVQSVLAPMVGKRPAEPLLPHVSA